MKHLFILMLVNFYLSGCMSNVVKDWSIAGGSRGDATVKLSYEYRIFENPTPNNQQALELAKQRCAAWGYMGAEPFSVQTTECNEMNSQYGCMRHLVTQEYQCMNSEKTEAPH